jgi:pilus assembly protein CpaB
MSGLPAREESGTDADLSRIQLLVPTQEIKAGDRLDPAMLKTAAFPRDQVPDGSLRPEDLQGDLYATEKLAPDKLINVDSLSTDPPATKIAEQLVPGYRAVTIEVDVTSGVEGWATPGVHVDVVVTYLDSRAGNSSQLFIENAVVLSFNRSTHPLGPDAADQKIESAVTVTLMMPTVDALKLRTAQTLGKIGLMVRSAEDAKAAGNVAIGERDVTSSCSEQLKSSERARADPKAAPRLDKRLRFLPRSAAGLCHRRSCWRGDSPEYEPEERREAP